MERYHKLIKLSNGEDIIATTENDCKDFKQHKYISVQDPVLIDTLKIARGIHLVETYTMKPWMKLAKDGTVEIPTESIIVAVDLQEKVIEQYEIFLDETSNYTEEVSEYTGDEGESIEEFLDSLESEYDGDGNREYKSDKEGPTFH